MTESIVPTEMFLERKASPSILQHTARKAVFSPS